jgi:hypothetical protein
MADIIGFRFDGVPQSRLGGALLALSPLADGKFAIFLGADRRRYVQTFYSKELIHTEESGVANLRFHDNSNLSVGPKSSVRLDKFVYDPNKSAGSVAVEAARGSFRFATGAQSKGSYQVKTPYGTLGIRG